MGTGSDIALETADVALGIKALFLITTLLGITGFWIAALADSGTTALVTANALRLLRFKSNQPQKVMPPMRKTSPSSF